ncbi:MAG: hypothetical protein AAGE52_11565 [Myxococcota bacterium]
MKPVSKRGSVTYYARPPWFTEHQSSLFDLRAEDDYPFWEVLAFVGECDSVCHAYASVLGASFEDAQTGSRSAESHHLFAVQLVEAAWTLVAYTTQNETCVTPAGEARLDRHALLLSEWASTSVLALSGQDVLEYEKGVRLPENGKRLSERYERDEYAVDNEWHEHLASKSVFLPPMHIVRTSPVEFILWGVKPEDVACVSSIVVPPSEW